MEPGGGYHIHDEGNEVGRKLEENKSVLDKTPLKTVISIFKIQFNSNVSSSTFPIS